MLLKDSSIMYVKINIKVLDHSVHTTLYKRFLFYKTRVITNNSSYKYIHVMVRTVVVGNFFLSKFIYSSNIKPTIHLHVVTNDLISISKQYEKC